MRAITDNTQAWYDEKATDEAYLAYADGTDVVRNLFNFEGRQYALSDMRLWAEVTRIMDRQIHKLEKRTIRILDLGCGPATWALRIVDSYRGADVKIEIVSADISRKMLELGQKNFELYAGLYGDAGVGVDWIEVDMNGRLPFKDHEFDVTMCLHTVLNHLAPEGIPRAVEDMFRVTKDVNLSTVRTKGGTPTVYACKLGDVRGWQQAGDWLLVEDVDGKEYSVRSKLFTVDELSGLFGLYRAMRPTMFGLDLFRSRFGSSATELDPSLRDQLLERLGWLEQRCESDPVLMNYANHIAIVSQ